MPSLMDTSGDDVRRRRSAHMPWVEKYRPKTISEVSHQDQVTSVLKTTLESGSLPHLLFYGPPGTGKTSTILAMARQMYGPQLIKDRVLEMNASDERGINVVRSKIKQFAQRAVGANPRGSGSGEFPVPKFKIIILDEADCLTNDAQTALRRTMETYSKVTRFCLICNYVTRIIEPLVSRCAIFRFQPLAEAPMIERMRFICEAEKIKCADDTYAAAAKLCRGDLRKGITFIQSAHRLSDEAVTTDSIQAVSGIVPDAELERLVSSFKTNSFSRVQKAVLDIRCEGYAVENVILQLFDVVCADPDLSDVQKARVAEKLAVVDKCLIDGADEELQLLDASSAIMSIYRN